MKISQLAVRSEYIDPQSKARRSVFVNYPKSEIPCRLQNPVESVQNVGSAVLVSAAAVMDAISNLPSDASDIKCLAREVDASIIESNLLALSAGRFDEVVHSAVVEIRNRDRLANFLSFMLSNPFLEECARTLVITLTADTGVRISLSSDSPFPLMLPWRVSSDSPSTYPGVVYSQVLPLAIANMLSNEIPNVDCLATGPFFYCIASHLLTYGILEM